jgi:hypothetical protein
MGHEEFWTIAENIGSRIAYIKLSQFKSQYSPAAAKVYVTQAQAKAISI